MARDDDEASSTRIDYEENYHLADEDRLGSLGETKSGENSSAKQEECKARDGCANEKPLNSATRIGDSPHKSCDEDLIDKGHTHSNKRKDNESSGVYPAVCRYSLEQLLALQQGFDTNRWVRIVADLEPDVVSELFSLEITPCRSKQGKRRKRHSSRRKKPRERGTSDSDNEESFQRLAFLVEGEPNFDSGPPQDGFEYLRRVIWEAARCPKVVIAKVDPKKLAVEQTPYMPKVSAIPVCSPNLLPTMEWKTKFVADFSELRKVLSNASLSEDDMFRSLPVCTNEAAWRHFCFGNRETLGELQGDIRLQKVLESDLTVNPDETFKDITSGQSPLLRIVLSLDEVSRATLFRYHVSWLEEMDAIAHDRALWLFALSAVVDKPLDDLTCASFRDLLRKCAGLRAEKKVTDEELYMLNILITIAGSYFGQADESVIYK